MHSITRANVDFIVWWIVLNVRRKTELSTVSLVPFSAHVRYMSSPVRLSVCLSSLTFVHPTQTIEIFGNVSMPFGTLAICDLSVKILRRSSQGNRFVGGVKHKSGSRTMNWIVFNIRRKAELNTVSLFPFWPFYGWCALVFL